MIASERDEECHQLHRGYCRISTGRSCTWERQFHKPVVATCDVHFLDPEDEVYRRIIMAGQGFEDADDQAPLYLTDHGGDAGRNSIIWEATKAEEVVITNTNMIADMM